MTSSQTTTAAGAVPAARAAPNARPGVAIPGSLFPLGATPGEQLGKVGTNFALASSVADERHAMPVRSGRHRDPDPADRKRR